jgi:TRAP transporter TAXI family solute receptor
MMSGLLQASRLWASIGVLLTTLMAAGPALAQNRTGAPVPNKPELGTIGERINTNTIAIVSGNVNGTYLSIAYDLSAVLDNGEDFRVLPVIGKGGGQNIKDVRFLKGVDLGITQSAILHAYRRSSEIGALDDKIVYLAKLFDEEMHVIVRADSGISMIDQLAGRKVNFSDVGSGTQLSAREIFAKLEIQVQEVNYGQADGLEKLKNGEIAATLLIAGKPTASTERLKTSDGFRILPVPYRKALQTEYLPATFTSTDYPGLIEPGQTVDTIAVDAVLIAFNWPKGSDRYRRIQSFVDQFFPRLAEFQKSPRHPKWRETNLAATVQGWKRFEGADEWLRKQQPGQLQAQQREQFDRFLAARSSMKPAQTPVDRDQLFKEFIQWSSSRERR